MQNDILQPPSRYKTKIADTKPATTVHSGRLSLDLSRDQLMKDLGFPLHQNIAKLEEETAHAHAAQPPQDISSGRRFWHHWSKRRQLTILFASLLILLVSSAGAYQLFHKNPPKPLPVVAKTVAPPKPTTIDSPLTGVQVAPELAKRPVTGIMIENSTFARPQSGIQDAGVVFEAIAEGGITRFLTLYQDSTPQYIGPVRSLRPYYIDWLAEFDASIAHVGGSADALAQIRSGGKDLDQFFNSGSYWRQPTRPAPHNVYTSFQRMDALNQAKGYTASQFTPWPRKAEKKLVTPTAKTININISGALYNSHYDYDPAANNYLRSEGSKPHIATISADDKTGQQLHPKVVIILIMPYHLSGKYSVYGTTGSGQAFIFQDGGVAQGNWAKADRASQISFTDAQNQPIKLNAGQTWVTALQAANRLTYTP